MAAVLILYSPEDLQKDLYHGRVIKLYIGDMSKGTINLNIHDHKCPSRGRRAER